MFCTVQLVISFLKLLETSPLVHYFCLTPAHSYILLEPVNSSFGTFYPWEEPRLTLRAHSSRRIVCQDKLSCHLPLLMSELFLFYPFTEGVALQKVCALHGGFNSKSLWYRPKVLSPAVMQLLELKPLDF